MINGLFVRFAGWGPCGPLNNEYVYDFAWLVVGYIVLSTFFGYIFGLISVKYWFSEKTYVKLISVLAGAISVALFILSLWTSLGESIRSFTKEDFFCDPIDSQLQIVFIALSLMATLSALNICRMFLNKYQKAKRLKK